jgi:hypothetical protein
MFILHYAQEGVLDCNNKVTAHKTHTEAFKAMLGQLEDALNSSGDGLDYDDEGLVYVPKDERYELSDYYARAGIWDEPSDEWHIYEV